MHKTFSDCFKKAEKCRKFVVFSTDDGQKLLQLLVNLVKSDTIGNCKT